MSVKNSKPRRGPEQVRRLGGFLTELRSEMPTADENEDRAVRKVEAETVRRGEWRQLYVRGIVLLKACLGEHIKGSCAGSVCMNYRVSISALRSVRSGYARQESQMLNKQQQSGALVK